MEHDTPGVESAHGGRASEDWHFGLVILSGPERLLSVGVCSSRFGILSHL